MCISVESASFQVELNIEIIEKKAHTATSSECRKYQVPLADQAGIIFHHTAPSSDNVNRSRDSQSNQSSYLEHNNW